MVSFAGTDYFIHVCCNDSWCMLPLAEYVPVDEVCYPGGVWYMLPLAAYVTLGGVYVLADYA